MMFAQFKEVPPLEDVKELFTAATGCSFQDDVSWKQWLTVDVDLILCIQAYIRPSHQKILNETAQGDRNACALLRQLLRPHGYCINHCQKIWSLIPIKEESKTVGKKEGGTVVWCE